jgi:hypothetical protein
MLEPLYNLDTNGTEEKTVLGERTGVLSLGGGTLERGSTVIFLYSTGLFEVGLQIAIVSKHSQLTHHLLAIERLTDKHHNYVS